VTQPNILLIILDAARAKNFGVYGHEKNTSPFIDAFSKRATLYTQARAPSIWTLPSHASMFTGLHVPEHDITSRYDQLEAGHTVWERLQHDTAIFSGSALITQNYWGLARGFETVVNDLRSNEYPFDGYDPSRYRTDRTGFRNYVEYVRTAFDRPNPIGGVGNGIIDKIARTKPSRLPSNLRPYRNTGKHYTEAFLDWQEGRQGWAACINLSEAHYPYVCAPEYAQWDDGQLLDIHAGFKNHKFDYYTGHEPLWKFRAIESLYDGCIRQADVWVNRLISTLEERGELDDTLVVITADHGEGFGERGRVRPDFHYISHLTGVHEVLLHVPLVVKFPGQTNGKVIDEVVSLTRFPDVVDATVGGSRNETPTEAFTSDNRVLACMDGDSRLDYHLTSEDSWNLSGLDGFDPSILGGYGKVVYETPDRRVTKFATWHGRSRAIDIYDARTAVNRDEDGGVVTEAVEEAFADVTDTDVRIDSSSKGGVDEDTKEWLEKMGYM